jgi:TRAP-type C4-dicarboxylate transport system substrate-binding protein
MKKAILAVLAGILLLAPLNASALELKLAHFMPTMHVQHQKAFVPFAEKVAELSGGEVTVKIYPGGALGNPKTMVDAIKNGITDIGFFLPEYVPGRFPRTSVFELPFHFDSAEHVTKVMYDLYDQDFAPDYEDFKVLWFLSSPLSQFQTTDRPIRTADDIKGMKIRSAGAQETELLKLLGANPVGMPISEFPIALEKGVIDGGITPFAALTSHKLIDLIEHITEVNTSGAIMVVAMSQRRWDSLPESAQKALDEAAGRDRGLSAARAFDQDDRVNIERAKEKGIQIYQLPESERELIRERVAPIYTNWVDKMDQKGLPAKKLLDDLRESAAANR